MRKPVLPIKPLRLDLRKVKDPAKRKAKQDAHTAAMAVYNEKKREYDEVLYPAYERAYQRAYNQSEQRKRQRQQEQHEQQDAAASAIAAKEAAQLAEREAQERATAEERRLEHEALLEEQRRAAAEQAWRASQLTSLRLLALRALESQIQPQYLESQAWGIGRLGFAEASHDLAASAATQYREDRRRARSTERWPTYTFHQTQAHFLQRLGLFEQAERQWRLALACKPHGKPIDAALRFAVEHAIGCVVGARTFRRNS